ncbi:MAG: carbamoyltransferase HypF [Chlorobi bacterium]|nr:carbamoyltransferase HypF [Chlorobiota bacterium]
MSITAKKIEIKGLVQGVGFRPFIYRLAVEHKLKGTVENNNRGVFIHVEGETEQLERFIISLPQRIPEAASITVFKEIPAQLEYYTDFSIKKSRSVSDEITEVSPDIGVCKACLEDMKTQPHRINYPFINCTNCGPRFTIIRDLPYDRHQTTMAVFEMCDTCRKEYTDILDRRFHAQPIACKHCGPWYTLHENSRTEEDLEKILTRTAQLLESGKILAIKGLGGYHLTCNPFDEKAVSDLRLHKNREGKPFALMVKDLETVKEYLHTNPEEEKLLTGWRKPIVLLKVKKPFAPSVSIGLDTVGVMLPYMPFHYLLFEKLKLPAIVLTSGNLSDEPIVINNETALDKLGDISEAVITYNRDIHNRTDDSVTFVATGKERVIRRSRSFAPSPVELTFEVEGIFAAGAELVNCFCIGKGKQAIMSQHIGDLKNMETLEFYKESIRRHERLFRFEPSLAAMDLHPDYLSTNYVRQLDIPATAIQHHHAHIASCMAENGLDTKVIGVSFDGTGYGTDGNIWGGEFMVCDFLDFDRKAHFEYIPQPGGDAVTKHPWRMMTAYLVHYFGENVVTEHPELFDGIDLKELEVVLFMIKNKINSPLTSSAGRLFDAVSSLLGICRNTTYHAEAPMRLEAAAPPGAEGSYSFEIKGDVISMKPVFEEMIEALNRGENPGTISAKFHRTISEVIVENISRISRETGIREIALSGGTFQNRIILEQAEQLLTRTGFNVYTHSHIPSNDGGIAP